MDTPLDCIRAALNIAYPLYRLALYRPVDIWEPLTDWGPLAEVLTPGGPPFAVGMMYRIEANTPAIKPFVFLGTGTANVLVYKDGRVPGINDLLEDRLSWITRR